MAIDNAAGGGSCTVKGSHLVCKLHRRSISDCKEDCHIWGQGPTAPRASSHTGTQSVQKGKKGYKPSKEANFLVTTLSTESREGKTSHRVDFERVTGALKGSQGLARKLGWGAFSVRSI